MNALYLSTTNSGWDNVVKECKNNPNALPCPGNLPCLDGQLCFAIGLLCIPATFEPTLFPSASPTTMEPSVTPTLSPSASPIGAGDERNLYFCGATQEDANTCSGKWCRSKLSDECPDNEWCYETTPSPDNPQGCNATAMNYSSAPTTSSPTNPSTFSPSLAPSTMAPTVDGNPGNYYCGDSWRDGGYEGECGLPCPG